MAEASLKDDQNRCPICIELYIQPRSLPTCRHTFCENCLLTFVLKLKATDGAAKVFDCPVCRGPEQFPENEEVTLEWIRTFPLNEEGKSSLSETRVSAKADGCENKVSGVTNCDPCKYINEENSAKEYCTDCLESLCANCISFHKRSKPTRQHKLVSLNEAGPIPELMTKLNQLMLCSKHTDRTVEMYCRDDDVLCCLKCAATFHRNCKDVKDIHDLETGNMVQETIDAFTAIKVHFEKTVAAKEKNMENVTTTRNVCTAQVQEIRKGLIAMCDRIEKHIYDESNKITENVTLIEKGDISNIATRVIRINENLNMLKGIAHYDLEISAFVVCRDLRKNILEDEFIIHELATRLKSTSVNIEVDSKLTSLIENTNVKAVVEMKIIKENIDRMSFSEYRYQQINRKKIAKLLQNKVRKNAHQTPEYSNGVWMPDGRIILVDSKYNFCIKTDTAYALSGNSRFNTSPTSVAVKDENSCYVTVPEDKKIYTISVENNMKIDSNVSTNRPAKAITRLPNGTLVVAWLDPVSFSILQIDGAKVIESNYMASDTKGRTFNTFDYIAVDTQRAHIIQPCTTDKAVFCFKFNGEPVFRYSDNLGSPRGVAVDRDGNVYVCDCANDSLHQVSPAGIQIRIIKDNIPWTPLAVTINSSSNKLLITQSTGPRDTIYIFEIK